MKQTILISCLIMLFTACNSIDKKQANEEGKDFSVAITSTPVDVVLSKAQQKEFDTYFSNFAEANLESFTQKNGIKNDELIRFSVMHNYINRQQYFENTDDYTVKIKKEHLDESAKKYFGKSIQNHKSIEGVSYSHGYYSMPRADGEAFTFAQINKLSDVGDHKFEAEVNVYSASSGWTGNTHDNPSNYAKDSDGGPKLAYKVKALIFKDESGKYQLLAYQRL